MHGPPLLCRVVANLPRLHRSYSALRLPGVRRPRLRSSLAFGLPMASALRCGARRLGRPTACARIRRGSRFGMGDRLPRTGVSLGDVRISRVTGLPLARVPEFRTPPDAMPARPTYAVHRCRRRRPNDRAASGTCVLSRPASSGPLARVPTHRRFVTSTPQGSLPTRRAQLWSGRTFTRWATFPNFR